MNISEYRKIRLAVQQAGHGQDIIWSEGLKPCATADDFFREYVFVVCNSGMKWEIATAIFVKVMQAVCERGHSARSVFGHPGKSAAIDSMFKKRVAVFAGYRQAVCKLSYCGNLKWIGEITKYHLAKNLGLDCHKPDRHLERLAAKYKTTSKALCERLAKESGDRIATVDVVLWRACAIGIIKN